MLSLDEFAILFIMAAPLLAVAALLDLLGRPVTDWTSSGHHRQNWTLTILFVVIIGPALYFALVKPKLDGGPTDHTPKLA